VKEHVPVGMARSEAMILIDGIGGADEDEAKRRGALTRGT